MSTSLLTDALERICDGVLALDADWHITFVNDTAAKVFSRTRESLLGKHVWEEFPEGVGTEFELAYPEAFRTQTPGRFELFSRVHRQWFEVNIHPAPSDRFLLPLLVWLLRNLSGYYSHERCRGNIDNSRGNSCTKCASKCH